MARWKNMSKRLAVLIMMGTMMLGSAMTAFAQSNENAETTQQEETTESTQSESTDTSDLVLEETDTTKATIHYSKTGSHIVPRKEG